MKDLLKDYSREPRIFFALAQTASLAAADATDEDVQAERLNRALAITGWPLKLHLLKRIAGSSRALMRRWAGFMLFSKMGPRLLKSLTRR